MKNVAEIFKALLDHKKVYCRTVPYRYYYLGSDGNIYGKSDNDPPSLVDSLYMFNKHCQDFELYHEPKELFSFAKIVEMFCKQDDMTIWHTAHGSIKRLGREGYVLTLDINKNTLVWGMRNMIFYQDTELTIDDMVANDYYIESAT